MGAELPVRVDLAAAIAALVDQVAKLLLELQECGLLPARLGLGLLWLFVHGVPSVLLSSISPKLPGSDLCGTRREGTCACTRLITPPEDPESQGLTDFGS
jgi:hypothetical protein